MIPETTATYSILTLHLYVDLIQSGIPQQTAGTDVLRSRFAGMFPRDHPH